MNIKNIYNFGFLDFNQSVAERYVAGYASIAIRKTNNARDAFHTDPYIVNCFKDGWFRKYEGPAEGYGLCINKISITSRNPVLVGDFIAYKCKIEYIANADLEEDSANFWLLVHRKFTVEDVLQYIENNKHEWRP